MLMLVTFALGIYESTMKTAVKDDTVIVTAKPVVVTPARSKVIPVTTSRSLPTNSLTQRSVAAPRTSTIIEPYI